MHVLVANLGSTSFKFRLFDMPEGEEKARGAIERIGAAESAWRFEIGDATREGRLHLADHAEAVRHTLDVLADPACGCLTGPDDLGAIGFKAVHGGRYTGVQRVTPDVLAAMEEVSAVAPAHNPPYIAAMRLLAERFPGIPLVAAFETGFHETIPPAWKHYGVPRTWYETHGIRRWGFHGASHRWIGRRVEALAGRKDVRLVSCHLGGSSSLCAIRGGRSVATTMGMSPQTGLLHNNRCGDFDPFALPVLMRATGKPLEAILEDLACRSGLVGLSGTSGDVRDLEQEADEGREASRLALDVFVADVRRHLGSMMIALGGLDWIAFTGGIGQRGARIREAVCAGLEDFGIILDARRNAAAGDGEAPIHAEGAPVAVWVIPTNEERIVAEQTYRLLEA